MKLEHVKIDMKILYLNHEDLLKETKDNLYPHYFEPNRSEKIISYFPNGFKPEILESINLADKVIYSEGSGQNVIGYTLKGKKLNE